MYIENYYAGHRIGSNNISGESPGKDHGNRSPFLIFPGCTASACLRMCSGREDVEGCPVLKELMIWQVNSHFTNMLIACSSWHLACFSGLKREGWISMYKSTSVYNSLQIVAEKLPHTLSWPYTSNSVTEKLFSLKTPGNIKCIFLCGFFFFLLYINIWTTLEILFSSKMEFVLKKVRNIWGKDICLSVFTFYIRSFRASECWL